ncbi:MAG: GrpB family protein [Coprothermobacterota bacterium]|nr:GrpB family protein [Coprothermobacterota bacterium]
MIGLERSTVRLIPYTKEWERLFEEENSRLQAVVGKYVLDIQHVGSTSIPGMVAKPIIDIGIAVKDFEEAGVCIKPIEQLGYAYKGENGIPRRHYFTKGNPGTHHVHVYEMSSRDWHDRLIFRDYLTQHPEIAKEYAELKMALAQRYPTDRPSNTDSKAPFVERVLRLARSQT